MDYWAQTPMNREQMALFAPTLDAMILEGHPVRLFDELLLACDWSEWEAEYDGRRGQPPIHPRILAAAFLYGMSRGIRSSRKLEYMLRANIDFMWLVHGHQPDHSTLCDFRRRFKGPLRKIFRQLNQIAMGMGLIVLKEVGLDGTQVKANNSRHQTLTADSLEQQLAELDKQLEAILQEFEAKDKADEELFESGRSTQQLPPELSDLQQRQRQLQQALAKVRAADESRRRAGVDIKKKPTQIPMTDPDSKVLPNKEGGYAPNYTPMAATDAHRGFIVDADVINNAAEHEVTVPCVERIKDTLGSHPEALLADGAHATGPNMEGLDNLGVDFYTPVKSSEPQPGNPALRDDPTQPIPAADWDKLPINPQTKRLDKSAFVYVEEEDTYYCPAGRPLEYQETKSNKNAAGQRRYFAVYRSPDCGGCQLFARCLQANAKKGRSISRDKYEKRRQQMAKKMSQEEAQAVYRKRLHTAETPFAIIKAVMNVRQFLLRGIENVKTEWLWVCTAFNLAKLARETAKLRAERSQSELATVN